MSHPRLEKLYNAMSAAGLDAVAINPGPTLTWRLPMRVNRPHPNTWIY